VRLCAVIAASSIELAFLIGIRGTSAAHVLPLSTDVVLFCWRSLMCLTDRDFFILANIDLAPTGLLLPSKGHLGSHRPFLATFLYFFQTSDFLWSSPSGIFPAFSSFFSFFPRLISASKHTPQRLTFASSGTNLQRFSPVSGGVPWFFPFPPILQVLAHAGFCLSTSSPALGLRPFFRRSLAVVPGIFRNVSYDSVITGFSLLVFLLTSFIL